jgi:hypothetical protein
MIEKFAALSGAFAVICACSLASVPAYSVPLTSLKADTNLTLVDNKNWNKGGNKNWNHKDNHKNWSHKGGNNKWSSKGHGGKHWAKYGKWHHGERYRGGYWRNGIFISLPFIVGDQCYDYLDWRDGAPRPGWYWVC